MRDYRTGLLPWVCGGEAHLREQVHDAGRGSHRADVREPRERERLRFPPRPGRPGAGRRAARTRSAGSCQARLQAGLREPAPKPPAEPPGVLPVPEPDAEDRKRPATWPAAATPPRRDVINRAIAPLTAQRRAAPAPTLSAQPGPPQHRCGTATRLSPPPGTALPHRCSSQPPPGTSLPHRCSSQPPAANTDVALWFAGEQRCHIDVTAEPPRRTTMRQRCSSAAPAPRTHLSRPDHPARTCPGQRLATPPRNAGRLTRGHRGSPALRRRALPSPPAGRFIPAQSHDYGSQATGSRRRVGGRGPGVSRGPRPRRAARSP